MLGKISARLRPLDGQITPHAIAPYRQWLVPHFLDDNDEFVMSIQSFLIQSKGKNIIVDTGVGETPAAYLKGAKSFSNSFLDDLAAAGFPRESIDVVVCTHLHDDHVGWNTMESGTDWVPTFPKARYLLARGEYERCLANLAANKPHMFNSVFGETSKPIVDRGLADLVKAPYRITDEVRLELTPGHTPWHLSVWVESDGERALLTGDATHHPIQWAKPEWSVVGEDDPVMSTETRRQLLDEYVKRPYLIIGGHYQTPCAGYLKISGQETRFIPFLP
jgi:glyoxylase-like metal-dependent hydrolase (beta-lactamase superfamily II)